MTKIYLACPYWNDDPAVMEKRKRLVDEAAAKLMMSGYVVFSPLSHTVEVGKYIPKDEVHADSWGDFWSIQDYPFVDWCDELHVLCLDGWDDSAGVQAEIARARSQGKPIVHHEPAWLELSDG